MCNPTSVGQTNEAFLVKIFPHQTYFKNRAKTGSNGFDLLQIVTELDIRRCV